jgi:hypothetical protein
MQIDQIEPVHLDRGILRLLLLALVASALGLVQNAAERCV